MCFLKTFSWVFYVSKLRPSRVLFKKTKLSLSNPFMKLKRVVQFSKSPYFGRRFSLKQTNFGCFSLSAWKPFSKAFVCYAEPNENKHAQDETSDLDKAFELAKNLTFWDPFLTLTPEQQEDVLTQARDGFDKNDAPGFFDRYGESVAKYTCANLASKKSEPKTNSKSKETQPKKFLNGGSSSKWVLGLVALVLALMFFLSPKPAPAMPFEPHPVAQVIHNDSRHEKPLTLKRSLSAPPCLENVNSSHPLTGNLQPRLKPVIKSHSLTDLPMVNKGLKTHSNVKKSEENVGEAFVPKRRSSSSGGHYRGFQACMRNE